VATPLLRMLQLLSALSGHTVIGNSYITGSRRTATGNARVAESEHTDTM
jgi:hypothetical protein